MLDLARLLAALGVIWIHTPRSAELLPTREVGRFAVPFFVAAAVLFVWDGARRHGERTLSEYALARVVRIYVPFLAWSAVYLIFKAGKAAAAPELANDFPGWEILWLGGFYHLWFMPFMLVVSILSFVVARAALPRPIALASVGVGAAVAGCVLAIAPEPHCLDDVGTWGRLEWNALPAALFGLSLAAMCGGRRDAIAQSWRMVGAMLTLGVGCMAWSLSVSDRVLAANLSGLCLLVAALASPRTLGSRALEALGGLALGIYCSHLLLIKTVEAAAAKLHWPVTWQLDVGIFVNAAVGSAALCYVLSRHKMSRWLVV